MSLTIQLPEELSVRLQDEAARRGVDPREFAVEIIRGKLPSGERTQALRSLFADWAAEDATDDPSELAQRRKDWDELRAALNADRTSGPKLFP